MTAAAVPGYLGVVLDDSDEAVGTCWLVSPGKVVTAAHVLSAVGVDLVQARAALTGPDAAAPAPDQHSQAPRIRLRPGLSSTAAPFGARLRHLDPVLDLALLEVEAAAWPAKPARLTTTAGIRTGTAVTITGSSNRPDTAAEHPVTASSTSGHSDGWELYGGGTTELLTVKASGAQPGMSGAPVVLAEGGAVIGMVTGRYNSSDGWSRDLVFAVGVESLVRSCGGWLEVELEGEPRPTEALQAEIRLGPGDSVTVSCPALSVEVSVTVGSKAALFGPAERLRLARAGSPLLGNHSAPQNRNHTPLLDALDEMGAALTRVFLPGEAGDALAQIMTKAEGQTVPVELALDLSVRQDLRNLPWEAMHVPGTRRPLALHYLVTFFRKAVAAPTPRRVPGPLRIVVAIASPIEGGGGALDYQAELRAITTAVREARSTNARVRIVQFATTGEIRRALEQENPHVLHISGHGAAGLLVLEDEHGAARRISAKELIEEAIPAGGMPPLICLAACESNASAGNEATSFADELVAAGAPNVIGTEDAVSDHYATLVFSKVYAELAAARNPDPVYALAQARREVRRLCAESSNPRQQTEQVLAGWSMVTVQASGCGQAITAPPEKETQSSAPMTSVRAMNSLPSLGTGFFVGRRREQLRVPQLLLSDTHAGVVFHGIGGIGKSTLTAEVLRRTAELQPVLVVDMRGTVLVEEVFRRIVSRLRIAFSDQLTDPQVNQLLGLLADTEIGWSERLDLLQGTLLQQIPLILVLDNFEDNLTFIDGAYRLTDPLLAEFLVQFLTVLGRGRLLVTCRYRFSLPEDATAALEWIALEPLSFAETTHLAWSLPQLDALEVADLRTLWAGVGGHPRTLETVDALLNRGGGRLPRITTELRRRLRNSLPEGVSPEEWLAEGRTLDAAIADAVTVAADDVLLPQLLATLSSDAQRLLLGMSVFREPVNAAAVLFAVGDDVPSAKNSADDDSSLRLPTTDLPLSDLLHELIDSTLLTAIPPGDGEDTRLFVHRWLAEALERVVATARPNDEVEQLAAERHRRAAKYWRWSYRMRPQDADSGPIAAHDLLEARHHHFCSGDAEAADDVAQNAADILHTVGWWDEELSLAQQQLRGSNLPGFRHATWLQWLGSLDHFRGDYRQANKCYRHSFKIKERLGDQAGIATTHQMLGILAQLRGDHQQAEEHYQQSLTINERLGDQAGIASTHHQLGLLAQERGDYQQADEHYQHSLRIKEQLGDQDAIATTQRELGLLAQERGDYQQAEQHYQLSLTVFERLGNQAGITSTHHKLGLLAQKRGDYQQAEQHYQLSLTVFERLGDQAGIASTHHKLGLLAQERGDYQQAEQHYQLSLTVFERLGNQAGITSTHHKLGLLAQKRGDYQQAEQHYQLSLTVFERLGDQAGIAASHHVLGILAQLRSDYQQAEQHYQHSLTINERLGSQADIAASHHQLGMLAYRRGDYRQAEQHYQHSLTINERLGSQADIAASHHQLGMLAYRRGDYRQAEQHYQHSLTINERLGSQADIAASHHQLGMLAYRRGDYKQAEQHYQHSLKIKEQLDDKAGIATTQRTVGLLAQERGHYRQAKEHYQHSLTAFEGLGDQAGIATTHHLLGTLAHDRGDSADAVIREFGAAMDHAELCSTSVQVLAIATSVASRAQDLGAPELAARACLFLVRRAPESANPKDALAQGLLGLKSLFAAGYQAEVDALLSPFLAELSPDFARSIRSFIQGESNPE
ncbi:tetratricopeptide repeat protein [Actinomyces ruminicola]|uniref:tetratricopeptide repeat protein n=2 Tax=Actinomyces ruminicola TaxID=332524 RepID=UPI0011C80803|nr:tetratricopeptide repeat protein [Actinomyces ruminicola]